MLPDLAEDPELADRFIREIKVLASLNHPNIAGLRTAFRLENQLLMVMEYVEGTTLDERTKVGRIPLPDSISYIMQALAALGYAHKRGVIHRDIKPANMMLTPDNAIKLMDFGIAKTKTDKKMTQTGTTMGSLFYMSAEQVQGGELDGRSDLYSIGVSLYELVTGTRPFQGKSDFDIMVAQLQQAPLPPIEMMPDLPKALNDIIMISLEKDPNKRFQTAEAFAAALGSISSMLNATPVQASAGSTPPVYPSATAPAYTSAPTAYNPPPGPGSATGFGGGSTVSAPPLAAGGTIPASGGYTATGGLPTVMAPQPQAPVTTAPPPPVPSHGVPAPKPSKSYTGLYMTLGALIVVAVLAVAAVMGTRLLKARAGGGDQSSMNSNSISVAPGNPSTDNTSQPGSVAGSPAVGAGPAQSIGSFGGGNTTATPVGSEASAGPAPSTENSANPIGSGSNPTPNPPKPRKTHNASGNLAVGGQSATPSVESGAGQVVTPSGGGVQTPTANSDAAAQQLAELSDLHDKLSIRATTVNEGVESLRKQMESSGNNLRSDISASQARMKMYMDKFDAAMNAKDPAAAHKYMSLAEREVENLERFLGH